MHFFFLPFYYQLFFRVMRECLLANKESVSIACITYIFLLPVLIYYNNDNDDCAYNIIL